MIEKIKERLVGGPGSTNDNQMCAFLGFQREGRLFTKYVLYSLNFFFKEKKKIALLVL